MLIVLGVNLIWKYIQFDHFIIFTVLSEKGSLHSVPKIKSSIRLKEQYTLEFSQKVLVSWCLKGEEGVTVEIFVLESKGELSSSDTTVNIYLGTNLQNDSRVLINIVHHSPLVESSPYSSPNSPVRHKLIFCSSVQNYDRDDK